MSNLKKMYGLAVFEHRGKSLGEIRGFFCVGSLVVWMATLYPPLKNDLHFIGGGYF